MRNAFCVHHKDLIDSPRKTGLRIKPNNMRAIGVSETRQGSGFRWAGGRADGPIMLRHSPGSRRQGYAALLYTNELIYNYLLNL